MEVDIEELATYPTESDDWLLTVLVGGVALLLAFIIIPIFAVMGYLVRAIRAGMADAEEPPIFDDWGDLLTEGLVATIIVAVYQIIPFVVFMVFVGGSVLAILTGTDAGAGVGIVGLMGGLFVAWILSLVFGYLGLAGVANYAREGSFGAGFDVDVIKDVATSRAYLVAWAWVIGINIVVAIITSLLNIIPFLGALIGVFVSFYALIIAGWLWGQGFAEATGESADQVGATGPDEGGVAET